MLRVVVGTAGHIDHGKTKLVEALTGIDCDRWAEEKSRGITIDLGFAHLQEDDLQLGFVDVPGHERFLHNALAGLGGIRVLLLVVAADEGIKPQTREHLDICSLLGIPSAVVALTKKDLVDADLLELAALEIEELLAEGPNGAPFAGAQIVPVSSLTGDGIDELKSKLIELARTHAVRVADDEAVRLPVDRAFVLKGVGVVVTGTLASGRVAPGDSLELLPQGGTARVRSIQVHGTPRDEALAGERTSLQLSGVELDDLARGTQLVTPGSLRAGRQLLLRFRLLPDAPKALSGWVPCRLHLFASEVVGRLRPLPREVGGIEELAPGEEGLVEVRLSEPVPAVRGDRCIVRRPSPATTLGGGVVLDPGWRRRRGKLLAPALAALQTDDVDDPAAIDRALRLWVTEAGERGTGSVELAPRLGRPREEVRKRLVALASEARLLEVEGMQSDCWLVPAAYQRVTERAKRVLDAYFQKDRLARGMPKAEAVQRILPGRAAELSSVYLQWLQAQKVLSLDGDLVTKPGRQAQLTGEESQLARQVTEAFETAGLAPPSPPELGRTLGAKPQILDGVLRYLTERGKLVRLPGGLILARAAVDATARTLRADASLDRFKVPQFKDHFGLSRKWAIPLLEFLDSEGVTRRLGDERMVVR